MTANMTNYFVQNVSCIDSELVFTESDDKWYFLLEQHYARGYIKG